MSLFPPLKERDRRPEIMDQPGLEVAAHQDALRGLRRVNRVSATASRLWSRIRPLTSAEGVPLEITDVACGGGDVAIALDTLAKRENRLVRISGVDVSPVALEFARRQAAEAKADVRFHERNVISDGLDAEVDVVVCSLFLHHLERPDAIALLREASRKVRRRLLVSDLVRGRWGYFLAGAGSRLLSRSKVVHNDGPLSVRAAFTIDEARSLASEADLVGATVTPSWPARFLLVWNRR